MAETSKKYGYNSTFPTRIRDLMGENKTTQKELSLICGVKSQSVSLWVNGETRPDILSLVKIAEHFNVSTDYLLGLTDYKTTDKATVEMCKALGLSEDAVGLLLGDVETSYGKCVARNHRKYLGEELEKNDLKRSFDVLACDIACTFNRLIDEYVKEYTYMHEHLDERFYPKPLLSLLQDFYARLDSKNFCMSDDGRFVELQGEAVITAETESGSITSVSFTPKDIFLTAAINEILARLNQLKTEGTK